MKWSISIRPRARATRGHLPDRLQATVPHIAPLDHLYRTSLTLVVRCLRDVYLPLRLNCWDCNIRALAARARYPAMRSALRRIACLCYYPALQDAE